MRWKSPARLYQPSLHRGPVHAPRSHAILTLIALGALAGCSGGGGSDAPTPTQPAQTAASLTVTAASTDPIASLGETLSLTATARTAGGDNIANPSISWSSNAPGVASVAGSGSTATVTAVGNGTATITATSGTATASASVTVSQRATVVAISGMPASLAPGATAQLSAEARDARQRPVSGLGGITFASGDQSVAIVSSSGLVTAISPGNASITATVAQGSASVSGASNAAVAFPVAQPTSAEVSATDQSTFTPQTVTISPGGTVTWSFASVLHNVTFRGGTGAPTNINNTASSAVSRTFPTAGTFNYDCTLHAGMTGTVIVSGSASTPGFTAILNGANERPTPVTTQGAGSAQLQVNGTSVSYTVAFSRLTGAPVMAHIHGPGSSSQAVGILVDFPTAGQTTNAGVLTGTFTASSIRGQNGAPPISLDSLLVLLRNGNAYVNVHTTQFPAGEIRGQVQQR